MTSQDKSASLALIGAGHWGRNILRNMHALGALRSICETDDERREEISAAYSSLTVVADPQLVFEDATIDAVAIATPAATHGKLVGEALEAGKNVFVEKPLCLDVGEAELLKDKAEASGLLLMVGHLLLYHPAYRALCDYVREGQLGKLRYIYSNRASLGKIRKEENALWSFAPHDISMILDLTERMPRRVVCNGGTYLHPAIADTSLTHLTFDEGLQAHIFVSWLHPYKDHRMVVIGSEGMAVFDDVRDGPDKLMAFPHQVEWDGALPSVNRAEGVPVPYDEDEPLKRECAHFLDCLQNGKTPLSDANEAIRVLKVLDGCQRSLSSGQPVDLET